MSSAVLTVHHYFGLAKPKKQKQQQQPKKTHPKQNYHQQKTILQKSSPSQHDKSDKFALWNWMNL